MGKTNQRPGAEMRMLRRVLWATLTLAWMLVSAAAGAALIMVPQWIVAATLAMT
jgi:hypothetical protein